MQRVLILSASNPAVNPRPRRMIDNLIRTYEVSAMGIGTGAISGVKTYSFSAYVKRNFWQECGLYVDVFLRKWDRLIWTENRLEIVPFLQTETFDFVICFDLPLLPIALRYKKQAKVIFDAQEYFPLWLTSSLRWNILFKRFNDELCKKYLPQCDAVLSVSPSFVERYRQEYGINPILYLSLPYFYDLPEPKQTHLPLKILYHGSLSDNRSIEELVGLSERLHQDLELHLVLVGGEAQYRKKIEGMIEKRQRNGQKIFLHSPVSFDEIIPFGAQFDIGLYFMPPKTYNLLATIPNKFFEYIGSSLMVVSTPNTDLVPLIDVYGVGRVSDGFDVKSVAHLLNKLRPDEVYAYRCASHKAHRQLNNQANQTQIINLLQSLG
ncbi:hypothetical protein BBW65_04730 [Helicobacter enhydrae]|uniref:Glycosyltransferase n=1 Tax=Helicobacter enhydrae TaxID=222136 RepID=A0A1B1U5W4_9HELI|nr:hypothetical protein [Helicobacter enhydrae]ANV98146.1 hypothetical protein BBW65_04730 [Helicobacter enhydrae]